MDQDQLNIGNCPHCTNIIFKNGAFNSNASFTMRCPSCQKLLEIEIRTKIEIIIKPAERYIQEKKKKFGKLPIIFLIPLSTPSCYLCFCLIMECTNYFMDCASMMCWKKGVWHIKRSYTAPFCHLFALVASFERIFKGNHLQLPPLTVIQTL